MKLTLFKEKVNLEEDIKKIVAEYFDILEDSVQVECSIETRGYGSEEYKVPRVKVKVEC